MQLKTFNFSLLMQLTIGVLSQVHYDIKILKYGDNVLFYHSKDNFTAINETLPPIKIDSSNDWTLVINTIPETPPSLNETLQVPVFIEPPKIVTQTISSLSTRKKPCSDFCSGDLIFEDNFNSMDWTKWQREIRIAQDVDDGEFVSYQNHPENCYVNSGQLYIVPTLLAENPGFDSNLGSKLDLTSGCTGATRRECILEVDPHVFLPPIVSARIRTKESFNFRYGRVEVRAKLPKGDWLFPLILLEPRYNTYARDDFTSGQMTVAFARGNAELTDKNGNDISGRRLQGGVLISKKYREIRLPTRLMWDHAGNEFHNYSLTWTSVYIALAVDGNEYARIGGGFHKMGRIENARLWKVGTNMAPFDQDFFITLGVAVGGHAAFPDSDTDTYRDPASEAKKPWTNLDPKASFNFWHARDEWKRTWNGVDTGLHVDYIRVYAL